MAHYDDYVNVDVDVIMIIYCFCCYHYCCSKCYSFVPQCGIIAVIVIVIDLHHNIN